MKLRMLPRTSLTRLKTPRRSAGRSLPERRTDGLQPRAGPPQVQLKAEMREKGGMPGERVPHRFAPTPPGPVCNHVRDDVRLGTTVNLGDQPLPLCRATSARDPAEQLPGRDAERRIEIRRPVHLVVPPPRSTCRTTHPIRPTRPRPQEPPSFLPRFLLVTTSYEPPPGEITMTTHLPSEPTRDTRTWLRFPTPAGLHLLAILCTVSCTSPPPKSNAPVIVALFSELQAPNHANVRTLLEKSHEPAKDSPTWPIMMYLRAEAHRELGATVHARDAFRHLVSWAVSNHPLGPYRDTWGGTGLSVVALWRWLEIAHDHGLTRPGELDDLLDAASKLQETRLYSAMVRSRLLAALPLLEERIRYLLAQVAWNNGRLDEAKLLYLDFLAVNSDDTLLLPITRFEVRSYGRAWPPQIDLTFTQLSDNSISPGPRARRMSLPARSSVSTKTHSLCLMFVLLPATNGPPICAHATGARRSTC